MPLDVAIQVNHALTADELFTFYQRNNICEVGFGYAGIGTKMTVYQPAEVGFQIIENILSEKECVSLLSTLSESEFDRSRAGARHLMRVPQVANLTQDPRLMQIAQRELGKDPFPFRATLFEKSGK